MSRTLAILLAVAGLALAVPSAAETPVEAADKVLATYHEDPSRLDRARQMLEDALVRERRPETMIALARVCLVQGEVRAVSRDDKLAAYERGREIAKRAIELTPRSEDAHFWFAANTGRWGQTKGVMRSLFLLPTMREEIDILMKLNPRSARTHNLAANVMAAVPGVLGGDKQKADEHFRTALEIDPRYTIARVDYASFLVTEGRHADARRELQRVIDERAPSSRSDWHARDLPRARALLESIKRGT